MKKPLAFLLLLCALSQPGTASSQHAGLPTVSLTAPIPETSEPSPTTRIRPGEFLLSRTGPATLDLTVHLAYHGSATPDHDYNALPTTTTIPAGQSNLTLLVVPIDDNDFESDETVTATLLSTPGDAVPAYNISPDANAATVTIHDTDTPAPSIVRIDATSRIAEETAAPLRRLNLVGEFTISRTGPTEHSQPVFIHYSGTATSGEDYESAPWLLNIPAHETSITLPIQAIYDELPEGIETVVASLDHCPPQTSPPLGIPCYFFEIDPHGSSATVLIREDGLTTATVHITHPADQDHFDLHQPIQIEATAIDIDDYINRVEFWAGDGLIGVSEIHFFRAPDPGSPIHHTFDWLDAPAGTHTLTARARTSADESIISTPVQIVAGPKTPNQPPAIAIIQPQAAEPLPANSPVEIVVETRDPDGFVGKIEFFIDGGKVGEQTVNFFTEPPPNQPQQFQFTWEHPMPGSHLLGARATDNLHATALAIPVPVTVDMGDPRPFLSVTAPDAFAVEPATTTPANTATFLVRRHGPHHGPLDISYSLHGRAANGEDYERLEGTASIPEDGGSVAITIVPLADELAEGIETVILSLNPSPAYHTGFHPQAVAVISDHPPTHANAQCFPVSDHLFHICFPAETGLPFRIEATTDFHSWSTVFRAPGIDGALHYIDDQTPAHPHRFFRIFPDP